ncbi:MAG TPA: hypothetical protein VF590_12810 [Isosphaeraceae bacterium]
MKVKPMLGDQEIPHVAAIRTAERRAWAELAVPGRVGGLFQDLGAEPTRIAITGSLYGDEARDAFLEQVRGQFRDGQPVTFVADIVTATEVQYVVLESLRVAESGTRPDELGYVLMLKESPPPPPPPDPFGALDASLLDQAAGFLDTITGVLDVIDALGSVPDLGNPAPPLTGALDGLTAATRGLDEALGPLRAIFGSPD